MNEMDMLAKRFRDGIDNFHHFYGRDPSACIMGYNDFAAFQSKCRNDCTTTMRKEDPDYLKSKWLGVEIFEGSSETGMHFGK